MFCAAGDADAGRCGRAVRDGHAGTFRLAGAAGAPAGLRLDDRPVDARPAPEDSGIEAEIDPPADRVETVAFAARTLADDILSRLAGNGLDCVCVDIEAGSDSGHTSRRRWRHEFRFSAAAVVDRVRWQLEGWYRSSERPTGTDHAHPNHTLRSGARRGSPTRDVGREERSRRAGSQGHGPGAGPSGCRGVDRAPPERRRRPADTGRRAPCTPREAEASPARGSFNGRRQEGKDCRNLRDRRQSPAGKRNPQSRTTRKAKAVRKAKSSRGADAPWPGRLPPPMPAVVLAEPEPLAVTDCEGAPVSVSGRGEASAPPQQLTDSKGRSRAVVDWAGPWPLDERWWHPRSRGASPVPIGPRRRLGPPLRGWRPAVGGARPPTTEREGRC